MGLRTRAALAALGGLACAWVGDSAARAATTTVQSQGFSVSNGGNATKGQTLDVIGFDTTLGTLTAVDVSVSGDSESGTLTHGGSGSSYFRFRSTSTLRVAAT